MSSERRRPNKHTTVPPGAKENRGKSDDERRPPSTPRISPARLAAFQILTKVEQRKGHSDDLLHGPATARLSQEDRNLATALVLGTLRWQIALEARFRPLLRWPEAELASPVSVALRLGAFQLIHLDRVPAYAVLNETVEQVREAGQAHAAGMVNAVLRKLASLPDPGRKLHETSASFAQRLGHPQWLVERWVKHYGRTAAMAICEFDQQEPGCGDLFASDAESRAQQPVMDDGSRLVAEMAAKVVPEPKRIWDCCAAPGGKTIILARRHPEARLLATDVNARRLHLLSERLKREAPDAKTLTLQADAQELPPAEQNFDLILCDVPCSGTGTIARNPEIRHNLQPSEFARQAARQKEILSAALERLASDGRLVYSTCSLEPEEDEEVVQAVLGDAKRSYSLEPVEPYLEALKSEGFLNSEKNLSACSLNGFLRTVPGHNFQGDGFFAAVLRRS